jgi:hypothetical protein
MDDDCEIEISPSKRHVPRFGYGFANLLSNVVEAVQKLRRYAKIGNKNRGGRDHANQSGQIPTVATRYLAQEVTRQVPH